LERPTGAPKMALGSELPPHPWQPEIQGSSSFLFHLEASTYPGLRRGGRHPPFQPHTESLQMPTLLLSTNNSNTVLGETRRQLWSGSVTRTRGPGQWLSVRGRVTPDGRRGCPPPSPVCSAYYCRILEQGAQLTSSP